jgi:hypothetical protein
MLWSAFEWISYVIQQPLMPHPLESWYDPIVDEPQLW